MNGIQNPEQLLRSIFRSDSLISATLSGPRISNISVKVTIRPLSLKGKMLYQISETDGQKAVHRNLSSEECLKKMLNDIKSYKQTFLYTPEADYHLLTGKKNNTTLLKKSPTKTLSVFPHNREKEYLLREGEPTPFLVHLGIMNVSGKVVASKRDKFRQINRFLETIEDILPHLDTSRTIRVVDFGCGKAYLTFALYHFLKFTLGYSVRITGLDLKQDVIRYCQELSESLGYHADLDFIRGEIKDFRSNEPLDLTVSLHACDTATDDALKHAIDRKSKVILCVPCCQHELFSQVKQESLYPLLKHGILKERFASLATDAARAQLLEAVGYRTQILEFIDLEHTPKNLLIRAVRRAEPSGEKEALDAYFAFKNHLSVNPSLEKLLKPGDSKFRDSP